MTRSLALLAALGVLLVGAWLLLGRSPRPAALGASELPVAAPEPRPADEDPSPAWTAGEGTAAAPAAAPPERRRVEDEREEELARATWVVGRVVLPPGTPADEELLVLAKGEDFEHGDLHRAAVGPDGAFSVAFSERTKRGWLLLEGRYLYLEANVRWRRDETPEPVVLEPRLGARVVGRVVFPAGEAAEGRIRHSAGLEGRWDNRGGPELAPDGAFELDQLGAAQQHRLTFLGERFAVDAPVVLRVEPGETLRCDLQAFPAAVLAGRVVDEAGEPVPGADLFLWWHDPGRGDARGARSADDGSFRLDGLPALVGELSVKRPGHRPLERVGTTLARGEVREGVELVLPRGGGIEGRVVWPDGIPAEARVRAIPDSQQGWTRFPPPPGEPTGADGAFRITGLSDEPHLVLADAARDGEPWGEGRVRAAWHARLDGVHPDGEPVVLTLAEGGELAGRVVGSAGRPPAFRLLARRSVPGRGERMELESVERTYGEGEATFRIAGLAPGAWSVEVQAGDEGSVRREVLLPTAAPVELVLGHGGGAALLARVVDPAGASVAGAEVEVAPYGAANRSSSAWSGRTGIEGTAMLEDLPAGAALVTALGTRDAPSETVEVELVGGSTADVELRLRRGGRIEGGVVDAAGDGVANAEVVVDVAGTSRPIRSVRTDAGGRFVAEGLPPGTVWVTARLVSGETLRSEVEIHEDASESVRLVAPLRRPVLLVGRIRVDGRAVAGVQVQASGADRRMNPVRTDGEGRYALELPGPGLYRLQMEVDVADRYGASREIDVVAAGERAEDFELALGRVSGSVLDADGRPVPSAWVHALSAPTADGTASTWGSARVDARGGYELELPAGEYGVRVDALAKPEYAPAEAEGIAVAAGAHRSGVDFTLREGGILEGVVRRADGGRAAGAKLWAVPADDPGRSSRELGSADANGRFRIGGVTPGGLLVLAVAPGASGTWTRVDVAVGETTRVDLEIASSTWLRIQVLDESGAPLSEEVVSLGVWAADDVPVGVRWNGDTGWAGPVQAGTYRVVARREDDGRTAERSVTTRAESEEEGVQLVVE